MKKIFFICIVCVFFISHSLFAQSRYLEDGISGPGFSFNVGIKNFKLTTIGMAAGYSIGGIMDFGVQMDSEQGTLHNTKSTNTDFDFMYNLIVVKQTEHIPFTIQLEGTYGYTNVSSDYLDSSKYRREGYGFSLGTSIYNELALFLHYSVLLGVKATYRNYIFTQTDITPSVPVMNSIERSEEIKVGVLAAFSIKLDNWSIISLGMDLLYSIMEPGVSVEPALSFTIPSR
ncbi:MAG: hypothetical protein GXP33_09800 [Spirochaetes bacterium]|nr:hypothetical protein [Spirochaetota bacterium]